MAVFKSAFAGGTRNQGQGGGVAPRCHQGMDHINIRVNVPTTALDSGDEQILLYKFPDDGDCWLFRGGSPAGGTSNATTVVPGAGADFFVKVSTIDSGTSSVWDIGIGDSDGVIDTALIANSTIGQSTSGTDYLDAFAAPLDVSGKYLIFDVTTSATTAVAGTVEVGAKVLFGKKLEVDSGVA
jgi:hypothetical protein